MLGQERTAAIQLRMSHPQLKVGWRLGFEVQPLFDEFRVAVDE